MSVWSNAWWNWAAPVSVQAAVIALLVAVILAALRRMSVRRPELEAGLIWLVPLRLIVPVVLTSPIGLMPAFANGTSTPVTPGVATFATPAVGDFVVLAFLVWLGGVGGFECYWISWSRRVLRRLRAGLTEAPDDLTKRARELATTLGLRRVPRLAVSDDVVIPCLIGWWRPTVVLPQRFVRDGGRVLDHVLLHEMAHVRRRDPWRSLFATQVQILFWFHPAAWWARWALTERIEIGCDTRVAEALGDDATDYRRTLLELGRRLIDDDENNATPALAFFRGRGRLVARLDQLTAWTSSSSPDPRWGGRCLSVLLPVTIFMGSMSSPAEVVMVADARIVVASEADAVSPTAPIPSTPGCFRTRFHVMREINLREGLEVPRYLLE